MELWKLTDPPARSSGREFLRNNPSTVLVPGADLSEFGYAWVDVENPPTYDRETEKIVAAAPRQLGNGTWLRGWQVVALSSEARASRLTRRRERARVTRPQLIKALAVNAVITPTAALQWAIGTNLPGGLDTAIQNSGNTAAQKASLRIDAVSAPEIGRLSPLFLLIKDALSLNDAQADTLFLQAADL